MSDKKRNHVLETLSHLGKLGTLARNNNEFQSFWIGGTLAHIFLFDTFNSFAWIGIALFDLLIGVIGIRSVVKPVEDALASCGLSFAPVYGTPKWMIGSLYPCQADTIEFTACGHPAKDFQDHVARIAAGLNLPVKEITEDRPGAQVLQAHIVRSQIPALVDFSELNLDELSGGRFFYGKTDRGFKRDELDQMIHMLVAGQTGSGKTVFLQQLGLTILARTREAHAVIVDMKGGVDFHDFRDLPNCELALSLEEAHIALDGLAALHVKRAAYLKTKNKRRWGEVSLKELEDDPSFSGIPIGPVLLIADELAELTSARALSEKKQSVHQRLSEFARLSRATGIHLVLGTQRPDRSVIDGQIKDNLVTRVCFSVPSPTASALVVGNMSAYTIGDKRGRAVVSKGIDRFFVQTPRLTSEKIRELADQISARLKQQNYQRRLISSPIKTIEQAPAEEPDHESATRQIS